MTVTVCILMFGGLTGGSVNPARTVGPAVATGLFDGIAIYLIAQLAGGLVAGALYRVFRAARAETAELKPGPILAK
jgi:glycerol uptake facilitator-like aquaporin